MEGPDSLDKWLANGVLISDGAWGTDVYKRQRQPLAVEDFIEIAVGFDDRRRARLKVGLSQLRLHEQRAEAQIDLGAIESPVGKRNAGLPSKDWLRAADRIRAVFNAEHGPDRRRLRDAGRAEDVHQQCVGAHGGVELAPAPGNIGLRLGQRARRLGVDLVEAAHPIGPSHDGCIS